MKFHHRWLAPLAIPVFVLTAASGPRIYQTDFAERQRRSAELAERLERGVANPERDAAAAAAAGRFELVWGVGMTGALPMGLTCNAPYRNLDGRSPLAFAELYASDVIPHCAEPSAACPV